jgi:hypothetical protein
MPETRENATFRAIALTSYSAPWTSLPDTVDYLAFHQETCPKTKRLHLQAWAYSKRAKRFTGWKKAFPGAHIERMYGTFAENDKYCSKEGELTTFGEKPMENGKKRTLQELLDYVTEGAEKGQPLRDIIMENPEHHGTFVQYHNGIGKLHSMAVSYKLSRVDKDFAPEVIYVWGEPGKGKTRYVREQDPDVYDCPAEDHYKWKDGYSGQDSVLYDNIAINFNPTRLLKEIDRYFIQVPIKGGYIGWRPKKIYITSIFEPPLLAKHGGFSDPQEFLRRVTKTIHLT